MKRYQLILLSLLSAVLLPLALPNEIFKLGNPLVGLFCLVPYFYAVCRSPSWKFSLLLGALFGGLSNALSYYWLMFFAEFAVWTLGGTVFGYILYNSILVLFLHGFVRTFPRLRVFVLAMIWISYEYLKSIGFLGFPWALMAHPIHSLSPFIQVADLAGVWGVSLLPVLVNTFLTETLLCWPVLPTKTPGTSLNRRWLAQGIVVAAIIACAFIYGIIRINIKIPAEKKVSVLLVQQNIDPWREGNRDVSVLEAMQLSAEGLAAAPAKPDIVIWSETSFQDFVMDFPDRFEQYPRENPFFPFIRAENTYFLVGAPKIYNLEKSEVMNATILITPEGKPVQYYGKQHPVPFAEELPFWNWPLARNFYKAVLGFNNPGWKMGNEYSLFTMKLQDGHQLAFGTPICFEDAFPDLNRRFILNGAELWINLSNVSWSRTESAENQMYVAAKFRAIENRRVLIRSTNSGVTSVIDPFGNTLKKLPLFSKNTLAMDVPVYKDKFLTLYTLAGDYLPLSFLVLLLAGLLLKKTGLLDKLLKSRKK